MADYLVQRFGPRGFDYIGDNAVDLPIWAAARTAYAPQVPTALRRAASAQAIDLISLEAEPEGWTRRLRPWLRAMRPHQWSKNLLVFLPIFASHDFSAFGTAVVAMLAFSLIASCVYVLNDLVDMPADRAHPRKRYRAFSAGQISAAHGVALAAALAVAGLGVAILLTPPAFLAVLMLYFITTFAYSFWLKRKLLVDIITLAMLYTLRILAGSAATGIVLSPWLLVFSMFIFFSLAAIKRRVELVDMARRGTAISPGRGYSTDDLPVILGMAIASGQAAVLVFALYISNPGASAVYARPELMWFVCLVLFDWLSRMALMAHRGLMHDDPIVFAIRDRVSRLCVLLIVAIAIAATFGG